MPQNTIVPEKLQSAVLFWCSPEVKHFGPKKAKNPTHTSTDFPILRTRFVFSKKIREKMLKHTVNLNHGAPMLYLLALQGATVCPFRVVDEISGSHGDHGSVPRDAWRGDADGELGPSYEILWHP